ncbi:MAG: ribonucrease, partial [Nocardioidaceae bacterium]|nr:ribonucrease [Nocardioidaceae bacterium]
MALQTGPPGQLIAIGVGDLLVVLLAAAVLVAVAVFVGVVLSRRSRTSERDLQQDLHEQRQDIERREHRITERQQRLDQDSESLAVRAAQVSEAEERQRAALERVAGLTAEEARAELVASIESDAKRQAVIGARAIERAAEEEAEIRARHILATAIQRLASEQTGESVVSLVHLPSDDMK